MKIIPGPYSQAQLAEAIFSVENQLTERFLRNGVITVAAEQEQWRQAIQQASFGRNTVMYDDQGNPSIMVVVPLLMQSQLLSGGATAPHPAFTVNGATKPVIYVAKYLCAYTGATTTLRAFSLRMQDPGNGINYDNARLACTQKGTGWHLMTNAEWACIALICKTRGPFWPRGNNNYGSDINIASEAATPSEFESGNVGRTLTGSGPLAWSHDGTPFGIYDLNGDVWEWVGGMRINAGEIQVLQDNNAADGSKDQSSGSAAWQAILQAGTLVAPGTALTLKYDFVAAPASSGAARINTSTQANASNFVSGNTFETLAVAGGVTVPNLLKLLALAPIDTSHGADGFWMLNVGEVLPVRGGDWNGGTGAGVFTLNLAPVRAQTGGGIGFRAAFC